MRALIVISALTTALCACGPDNQAYCEEAQADIVAAYDECGDTTDDIDLQCELYADTASDCSEHFSTISNTVMCENGVVTFEYGSACR